MKLSLTENVDSHPEV